MEHTRERFQVGSQVNEIHLHIHNIGDVKIARLQDSNNVVNARLCLCGNIVLALPSLRIPHWPARNFVCCRRAGANTAQEHDITHTARVRVGTHGLGGRGGVHDRSWRVLHARRQGHNFELHCHGRGQRSQRHGGAARLDAREVLSVHFVERCKVALHVHEEDLHVHHALQGRPVVGQHSPHVADKRLCLLCHVIILSRAVRAHDGPSRDGVCALARAHAAEEDEPPLLPSVHVRARGHREVRHGGRKGGRVTNHDGYGFLLRVKVQGVVPTLAPDARPLHTPKGCAEIAHQPAVHPQNPRLHLRRHSVRAVDVLAPHGAGQAVLDAVGALDGLLLSVELVHSHNRPKYLLRCNAACDGEPCDDGGVHVISPLHTRRQVRAVPTQLHPAALLLRQRNVPQHLLLVLLGDQCTHRRAGFLGVAHSESGRGVSHQARNKSVVDGAVHKDA
mmetsp:Transcript_24051/g.60207  ORF Transcript_24051/g.60207 Transcript_24051/m.60207 type:complete len:448 (-) Transcript_24051:466-1809(-)